MKHFLFLLSACFFASFSQAQSNYYLFRTGTATYTELANDTPVVPANFGSGDIWAFDLNGETFSFFGKNYVMDGVTKKIMFSNSGHMRIDDDTTLIILDGLFYFMDSIDNNSRLSYKTEGTANNKILKVQWKNLKIQSGPAGNFVNFQVWLHQATGIFEIHYGPCSANNQSGYTASSGPNVGLFYAKQDFSKMYEKIWITQSPSSYKIDSAKTVAFSAMTGVPANGTVYRFIPKHIAVSAPAQAFNKQQFNISPNPANTGITITSVNTARQVIHISVADMAGRVIYKGNMQGDKTVIDTRNIPAGSYYISLQGKSVNVLHKIVVAH